jgi:hypothetical protein
MFFLKTKITSQPRKPFLLRRARAATTRVPSGFFSNKPSPIEMSAKEKTGYAHLALLLVRGCMCRGSLCGSGAASGSQHVIQRLSLT